MDYITLDLLKKHLNIDSDFTDDDTYLNLIGDVAEKTIQRHICCILSDMTDDEGNLPSPLIQAILLYSGDLYNSRESNAYGVTPTEVPHTLEYILGLYKNYSDTTSEDFINSVLDDIAKGLILIDTNDELVYGDTGELVFDTEFKKKAIKRIYDGIYVDSDGKLRVRIERI